MRSTGTLTILLSLLLPAWPVRAGEDPAEQRIFELFRAGATNPCGPGSACDNDVGLADRPEVVPADPLYPKVSALFSRGCRLSGEAPPPIPSGRLVSWDIDGDRVAELVFAGGCSPEPYFTILKGTGENWSVWLDYPGRLLSASRDGSGLYLVSARDAYGVERAGGVTVRRCDPQGQGACAEWSFLSEGDWRGVRATGSASPCTTIRDADLRSGPEADDTPQESGMGFDWPGNLTQRLAMGSTGWFLEKDRGADGAAWALCVFPDPITQARDQDPGRIMRPKLTQRVPWMGTPAKLDFLVGWMKFEDLAVDGSAAPSALEDQARLVVVHQSEMSGAFSLVALRYSLDDQPIYDMTAQDVDLQQIRREEIARVAIASGHHDLKVHLEYQGRGRGAFSYLQGYRFKVDSRHPFHAAPGQTVTLEVTGLERGDPSTPLEERPTVRWAERKEPPDAGGPPSPPPIDQERTLPRFTSEGGFDFEALFWDDGFRFTYGWWGAFGVRLVDRLYLKARITLPMFFLLFLAGNHLSAGGELEYLFLVPQGSRLGLTLGAKAGLAYDWHSNGYVQVLGPEADEASECGSGIRTWASIRLGFGTGSYTVFLDLGVDVKRMDVKNHFAVSHGEWFVGPAASVGAGGRF